MKTPTMPTLTEYLCSDRSREKQSPARGCRCPSGRSGRRRRLQTGERLLGTNRAIVTAPRTETNALESWTRPDRRIMLKRGGDRSESSAFRTPKGASGGRFEKDGFGTGGSEE